MVKISRYILRLYYVYFLCIVFLFGSTENVFAQILSGSADPARSDKNLKQSIASIEDEVPTSQDYRVDSTIPEAKGGFVLKKVKLSGLTVFSEKDFQRIINEYIGRSVDLKVLEHLASRITSRYREDGYFLSKTVVLVQEIKNGEVTLQIIEGYVYEVIIDDPLDLLKSDFFGITSKTIERIKALNALHGPSLERYLLLLNEGSGLSVKSIISAAENGNDPGAVVITLKVSAKPQDFCFSYDNHGSEFIGPHRSALLYRTGKVLTPYDTVNLQFTSAFPVSEVAYVSADYSLPLNEKGLYFNGVVSYSNSEPGTFSLKDLEVESNSLSWEGSLIYPVIRSRKENLNMGASINFVNSGTEFLGERLIHDRVRSIILSAEYDAIDHNGNLNVFSTSLHQGLDILSARETGSDNLSRVEGRSDFFKIEALAVRIQRLSSDFNIQAQIKGQYAPDPLLSSEEFGYGGVEMGRAYDDSELTGDRGIAGSLELRYVGLDPIKNTVSLTPFAFYDIGKVWNEDENSESLSAASAGFGAYYQGTQFVSGSITVAWPITKRIADPVMGGDISGPRILFNCSLHF